MEKQSIHYNPLESWDVLGKYYEMFRRLGPQEFWVGSKAIQSSASPDRMRHLETPFVAEASFRHPKD